MQRVSNDEERDRVERQAEEWVDMQAGKKGPGDVRADHDERPMGQVDDIENAPDQTEAEGDRHIDAAQQQAEDDLLGELAHERLSRPGVASLACAPGGRRI